MRIIVCNLQMFSNEQTIQVIDTEHGLELTKKVEIDSLPSAISFLAKKYEIDTVKLIGANNEYGLAWADEIQISHVSHYGKNYNLNVEVL